MTDVEERLALADRLDACVTRSGGIDLRDPQLLREAAKAIRLSASPAQGYAQACVNKALEFETRWELAASNDELRSDATRHRHYATAAKLIRQELAAIAAIPIPAGAESEWQPIETAPKDGSCITVARFKQDELKWLKHSHWMTAEDIAEQEGGLPEDYEAGWTDGDDEHDSCFPTHWMPLPKPPALLATFDIKKRSGI